tara:strand:+ start:176 stop:355 length:180 start_codon:yes stop_codon:yes gene_type:complete
MATGKRKEERRLGPQVMGELAVKDLVENIVRDAVREQAREVEKHLQSIHERLNVLEKVR